MFFETSLCEAKKCLYVFSLYKNVNFAEKNQYSFGKYFKYGIPLTDFTYTNMFQRSLISLYRWTSTYPKLQQKRWMVRGPLEHRTGGMGTVELRDSREFVGETLLVSWENI